MPDKEKNEIYARIPNSYEEKSMKITDALRKSTLFGAVENEWNLSIEATFADSVIVDKSTKEGQKYYKADWSLDENGDVILSNVKDVEVDAVVKIKNENQQIDRRTLLNEDIQTSIFLEEVTTSGKKQYKGKVNVAQIADTRNRNGRIYPEKVLQESVTKLKEKLKTGPIPMYRGHRTNDGKNTDDLNEIVAVINDVNYHSEDKTVSLDDITFVETQAGKDMIALAEARMPFQVSQRGAGSSHLVKGEDGKVNEIVDVLEIDGWDALRSGKASVSQADMEFQVLTEEAEMPDKKVLTEEEVKALLEAERTKILNEFKEMKPEEKKEEKPPETPKPEVDKSAEALNEMTKQLNEMKEFIEAGKRKEGIESLTKAGEGIINETLKDEKYKIFNEADKKHISSMALKDVPELYGKVDVAKPDEFKSKVDAILNEKVEEVSHFIAQARLQAKGYGNTPGNGIQHVEMIRSEIPNGERIMRLEEAIDEINDPNKEHYKLPKEHRFNKAINEVMDAYYTEHYKALMNESGENFTQSDIGASIRSINAAIIPAALKRLTATRYCNVFSMKSLREDVLLETLLPAITSNSIHTNVALLQPTEDGTLSTVGSTLTAYPMIATEKGFNTRISARAIATAKNSGIEPVALSVAAISKQMAQIMDQYIWEWIIARAQAYSKGEVTSVETLTQVGSTDEYYSAHEGWILYEVYRDTTSTNPTDAKLINLFGSTSGNTYQAIVVDNSNSDPFTYGTHYTINAADGSITLTEAGVTLKGGHSMRAKYSYTTNAKFWSVTGGGSTVTLYDWLMNLQQKVGQAKATIRGRGYEPDFAITDITVEDLISKGPNFDASKAQPGTVKDALGNVNTYDGLPMDRAGWLPSGWLLVGKKGTVTGGPQYGIHTAMTMQGPKLTAAKTYQDFDMYGFDAIDYPNNTETMLVGITDLASL